MRGRAAVLVAAGAATDAMRGADLPPDLLARLGELGAVDADVRLYLPSERLASGPELPKRVQACLLQTDTDRPLLQAIVETFAAGYERIVALERAVEAMPVAAVEMALQLLGNPYQLVLGLGKEGGVYLLGMNELYPTVVGDAAWLHECRFVAALEQAVGTDAEVSILPEEAEETED